MLIGDKDIGLVRVAIPILYEELKNIKGLDIKISDDVTAYNID